MRVWDVHPGYLSRQSLLGQHVEIHAIYNVLAKGKKGYANHPETLRLTNNLEGLKKRHDLTMLEMFLRGYKHKSVIPSRVEVDAEIINTTYLDSPARQFLLLKEKYQKAGQAGRIPLPINCSEFWSHHKYSIMARGYRYYKIIQQFIDQRKDYSVWEDDILIESILSFLQKEANVQSSRKVMDNLWGCFDQLTTKEEQNIHDILMKRDLKSQLDYIFKLSIKYDIVFLLQSTIFADLKLINIH